MPGHRRRHVRVAALRAAWACFTLAAAGCGAWPVGPALGPAGSAFHAQTGDGNWVEPIDVDAAARVPGPFGDTVPLALADAAPAAVRGRIDFPGQTATFSIGAVQPGDRLRVEVFPGAAGLDPAVAIFDAALNWMHLNDDRDYASADRDARADLIVRVATDPCYVVVTSSPRSDTVGEYVLRVTRTPAYPAAAPAVQWVYLDFRGAEGVEIGRRTPVNVPQFSGALIDPVFAGETAALIALTVDRVRRDYAGYDVVVVSSAEEGPPAGPHSTVYFGSYNPALLGIADNVDTFNAAPVQEAIVFVDTFAVFMSQDPTVDEMADALANVASHEIGHLVGLQHTRDARDIMDTSATLRQMLAAQTFRRAPLNEDTFPVGYQDAAQTLLRNVGGDPQALARQSVRLRARPRDPWYDEGPSDPARSGVTFGTGCAGH